MADSTPYLETLDPSADRTDATIRWMRFLTDRFGTTGALNCLRYYEDVGWIGPRARERLVSYVRGMSREPGEADASPTLEESVDSLEGTVFAAHARSLAYIARIDGESLADEALVGRMANQRTDRQLDADERPDGLVGVVDDT
ncbi:FlaD/FlaE family flagellar protein [Natronococcus occultus]|uniref:Putative archaeal flagellar protein D/E n=1 Tax=Natronococcus occultus SP4 TaxID=694430 RepID=L0JYG8_9EURY|nr:FlaD/FlaE family flagellar protein [Natronococcus occultus]AGB38102.1 putative archaeal flagellar protein D/E [Natronococcus occultus SP4]